MEGVEIKTHGSSEYIGTVWEHDGTLNTDNEMFDSIIRTFIARHGADALVALSTYDNGYWYGAPKETVSKGITRRVRTPAGSRHYSLPIGAPIVRRPRVPARPWTPESISDSDEGGNRMFARAVAEATDGDYKGHKDDRENGEVRKQVKIRNNARIVAAVKPTPAMRRLAAEHYDTIRAYVEGRADEMADDRDDDILDLAGKIESEERLLGRMIGPGAASMVGSAPQKPTLRERAEDEMVFTDEDDIESAMAPPKKITAKKIPAKKIPAKKTAVSQRRLESLKERRNRAERRSATLRAFTDEDHAAVTSLDIADDFDAGSAINLRAKWREDGNTSRESWNATLEDMNLTPLSDDPAADQNDIHIRKEVRRFIDKWAETSQDHDSEAVALQMAVQATFGVGNVVSLDPNVRKSAVRLYEREKDTYDAIVQAMYDVTQHDLRKAGITEVRLWRGMRFSVTDGVPDWVRQEPTFEQEFELSPLSSWSTEHEVAKNFAGSSDYDTSVVLTAVVPAENIFSTAVTGLGCLHEGEFVILGENQTVRVRNDSVAWADTPSAKSASAAKHEANAKYIDTHAPVGVEDGDDLATVKAKVGVWMSENVEIKPGDPYVVDFFEEMSKGLHDKSWDTLSISYAMGMVGLPFLKDHPVYKWAAALYTAPPPKTRDVPEDEGRANVLDWLVDNAVVTEPVEKVDKDLADSIYDMYTKNPFWGLSDLAKRMIPWFDYTEEL